MFDYYETLDRDPYFREQPDGTTHHISQIAGDKAIEFLRSLDDKPFSLSISFNAPHAEDNDKEDHYPWPRVMDGTYDDVSVPAPRLSEPSVFESQPEFLKDSLNRERWYWRWATPETYQKNIKGYYRMVSGVDHVMGRVLEEIDRLGLAENTVVVFSSDNGYYLGSRGFAGKWSHYEESLRVPLVFVSDNGWIQKTPQTATPPGWFTSFSPRSKQSPYDGGTGTPIILRWPSVIAPARYETLASTIDIVPTIPRRDRCSRSDESSRRQSNEHSRRSDDSPCRNFWRGFRT